MVGLDTNTRSGQTIHLVTVELEATAGDGTERIVRSSVSCANERYSIASSPQQALVEHVIPSVRSRYPNVMVGPSGAVGKFWNHFSLRLESIVVRQELSKILQQLRV